MIEVVLILILAAFSSEQAWAETTTSVPDVRKWSSEIKYDELIAIRAPMKILLLESFLRKRDGKPLAKALDFDSAACAKISYISCSNPADFNYALLINKIPAALTANKIMELTGVNAVVYPNKGRVVFVGSTEKVRKKIQGLDKLTPNMDVNLFLDKMLYSLGYDGVVLGIKDDFILVGTLEGRLGKPDLQGLLLKDSESNLFIKTKEARIGAALISLVGQYQGYAVFRTIIKASSFNMAIGQKVIFERRRENVVGKMPKANQDDSNTDDFNLNKPGVDSTVKENIKSEEASPDRIESTKSETPQVAPVEKSSPLDMPSGENLSK